MSSRRGDRHLKSAHLEVGSRFHTDEARADDDYALRLSGCLDNRIGVRKTAQHEDVLQSASGDGAAFAYARHSSLAMIYVQCLKRHQVGTRW